MAEVLSTKSKLRTGIYKTSTSLFFTPSKLFEAQITEIFDEVWPTVTSLKMLRWQVKGYYEEYCINNNSRLSSKFVEFEDKTNRPNLYRTCIDEPWEEMEFRIAKNLLTNIFACYEGWVASILELFNAKNRDNSKALQFPSTSNPRKNYNTLITRLSQNGCPELISGFYDVYKSSNKHYNIALLDNWLLYYRYFKECRNNIIHNGGQTNQMVVDAYGNIQHLRPADLDVNELPQIIGTNVGDPLQLTLRGVVGFSQLVIKIVSTFDIEMIRCEHADIYFADRILQEILHKYSTDPIKMPKQVNSVVQRGRFRKPEDAYALYPLLQRLNVMR